MHVLVTAASRHGSTTEMAQLISGRLTDAGLDVTVLPPDQVDSLAGYDAAVIGSAIYIGRWMQAARDLVERCGPELATLPVWLFSSGPVGEPPKPEGDPTELPALLAATAARDHRVFAGRIERARLGPGERVVLAAVRVQEGDFRPLNDISQWANGIALTLREATAVTA